MSVLRNIAIAVIAISFFTFVALFGQLPALRKTPIGWLQRLLCLHIPNGFRNLDERTTGGAITVRSRRLGQYLFYEKNPIVMILFLFLMTGSITLFLLHAIPELSYSLIIPIPLLVTLPYTFTYLCARHRAHHIAPSTHASRMTDYPYDHTLFHPNHSCTTCHLIKPARSKHCSLCNTCIAMCDHHCPWINNCVGRGNYRHFLALLLSLGVMEIYGAWLSWHILSPLLATNPNYGFFTQEHWDEVFRVTVVAINVGGLSIAGVGMLAAATAALPLGLLAYHCYLIWAGMTTNESQKWADLREDMADGFVFKGSKDAIRRHLFGSARKDKGRSALNGAATGYPGIGVDSGTRQQVVGGLRLDGEEPEVDWPISSDQIVVRTGDGRPPTGQEMLWSQIWSLSDVVNLYDLGGVDNFSEMLRGR